MRLTFPLRSKGLDLLTALGDGGGVSQTVPYGTSSMARGRLQDARGEPIANQEVVVVDHFDSGSLFPRVERVATTDDDRTISNASPCRSHKIDEGPTFTGTRQLTVPADDEVGKFTVRGAASFRPSTGQIQEGNVITLSPAGCATVGARIPAGGKLVEVQYRLKTRPTAHPEGTISNPGQRHLQTQLPVLKGR